MTGNRAAKILTLMGIVVLLSCGYLLYLLWASLPMSSGSLRLAGLNMPVTVEFDRRAIPKIWAENRQDAFQALGFVTASERVFQMDLMRRKSSGRLAEIFGARAAPLDRRQRLLALTRAASEIVKALPAAQRRVLAAYAGGVNEYLRQQKVLPPEFLALGYAPEPWRQEDSMLVALGMFQSLAWRENEERMLTVMAKCLPPEVTAFLTPDTDIFSMVLTGGAESRRPATPIPSDALKRLREGHNNANRGDWQISPVVRPGSNSWAVTGAKTPDGRAIVANDMHLGLRAPNIWYRADLRYGDVHLSGITLPGVPMLVAGSNDHLAWGFTNALTDTLDFVFVETDPANPSRYNTPSGWKTYEVSTETIRVKGGPEIRLESKRTIWGPVSATPLQGREVALKWSALDPAAVDLGLLLMDRAITLEQGMAILNQAGIPSTNVILADSDGRIGWTLAGKVPLRRGFDGSVSRSWANGRVEWEGYIPGHLLPRVVAPPEGYLVTANQRAVGKTYPYPLGQNYENSYRAYRIGERLRAMSEISERAMLELQLDTRSEFFDFYREIALSVLTKAQMATKPSRIEMRDYIDAWNGKADNTSLGLPLLNEFRRTLMNRIFPAYLGDCKAMDGSFEYHWFEMDTPLRSLLTAKDPKTLPAPDKHADWNSLLVEALDSSADRLLRRFYLKSLEDFTWGRYNEQLLAHPFGLGIPALGVIFNLPGTQTGGCGHCINVSSRNYGVTERMVVSPGHLEDALLHMPGGQSGHFLSKHYRDQHPYWVEGVSLSLLPERAEKKLRFFPSTSNTPLPDAEGGGNAFRNSSTD